MSEASCRPCAESIRAAAARLRGHVVATPLVGGLLLPGFAHAADVRIKPELLQPGGSAWYRGHLHLVLRAMGRPVGLAWAEGAGSSLAAAVAATAGRIPLRVFVRELPEAGLAAALAHLGAVVERCDDPQAAARAHARSSGAMVLPGLEHPDIAAGIATIGLELASTLPFDAAVVYVPEGFEAAVGAGLAAGGHGAAVVGVPQGAANDALGACLAGCHRLHAGAGSLSVLAAALRHEAGATVAALLCD